MKNSKKWITLVLVCVLALAFALGAAACAQKPETKVVNNGTQKTDTTYNVGDAGTVSIIVAAKEEGGQATEYVVEKSKLGEAKTVLEALDYFKATNSLTYTSKPSDYGAFLTQVDNLSANDDTGAFIAVYTSVEEEKGNWAGVGTVEYKGFTLTSASVGVSSATIPDGAIIYFAEEIYSY